MNNACFVAPCRNRLDSSDARLIQRWLNTQRLHEADAALPEDGELSALNVQLLQRFLNRDDALAVLRPYVTCLDGF